MSINSDVNRGQSVGRAKNFRICKLTKKRIEISDKHAVVPSLIFDTVPEKKNYLMRHPVTHGKVHPCTGTEALYRPYGP